MCPEKQLENQELCLKKELGLFDCSSIILSIIIGSGIFSVFPMLIAGHHLSVGMIILVWVFGGVFAWFGSMCYAELASIFPTAGGDYTYLRKVYSFRGESLVSFLFAWSQVFVIRPSSIAALALIVGNETNKLLEYCRHSPLGSNFTIAVFVVTILTLTNILDIKVGKKFQNLITALKVAGIIFIIGFGLMNCSNACFANFSPFFGTNGEDLFKLMAGFWSALVLTMWVYGGWNEAAYVAEETKNPSKDIPKALFSGIFLVTILYVMINIVYIGHLTPQGLSETSNPASDLMLKWFGINGSLIMSLIISISAIGAINALIFTGGRMSYAISKDFSGLSNIATLHSEYRTPRNALFANLVITAVLLVLSRGRIEYIENLTYYTSGVFWYFIGLVIISLILLRRQLPPERIPFKVPLFPFFPIMFLLIIVGLIWGAIEFKPYETLAGICILTVGIPLYYVLNFDKDKRH
ncbi:MAG: amino acid permease [Endomicrobiales bacterium]|nr:amino acid permease [Endomicrobiales bacterium]